MARTGQAVAANTGVGVLFVRRLATRRQSYNDTLALDLISDDLVSSKSSNGVTVHSDGSRQVADVRRLAPTGDDADP